MRSLNVSAAPARPIETPKAMAEFGSIVVIDFAVVGVVVAVVAVVVAALLLLLLLLLLSLLSLLLLLSHLLLSHLLLCIENHNDHCRITNDCRAQRLL